MCSAVAPFSRSNLDISCALIRMRIRVIATSDMTPSHTVLVTGCCERAHTM